MIYTLTLNPALDRTLWIKKIVPDDSNRVEKEQTYAGGKGIDVSKVLTTFGIDNKALGFVGGFAGSYPYRPRRYFRRAGFAGEELEGRLLNEGISFDFIRISNETRTNIILNDMAARTQTVFTAKGPTIKPYELTKIIHKIDKLKQPDMLIIISA